MGWFPRRLIAAGIGLVIAIIVGVNKQRHRMSVPTSSRDDVVNVPENDPRMKAAIAEAKRRWPEFVKAFSTHKPGQVFLVKAMFIEGEEIEWMWVKPDQVTATSISGTLSDEPEFVKNVKQGQRVTKSASDIGDWAFGNGDQITGSFSDKVMQQVAREQRR
jgi:uncharacterized protein YegJ (DUF2314 family)